MQATRDQVVDSDVAVTLITASRRYQVAVADLKLGMFVAELDRIPGTGAVGAVVSGAARVVPCTPAPCGPSPDAATVLTV